VAKHRKPKSGPAAPVERAVRERRQSPSVILAGTAAAALSTVLVFGHATDTTVDNSLTVNTKGRLIIRTTGAGELWVNGVRSAEQLSGRVLRDFAP